MDLVCPSCHDQVVSDVFYEHLGAPVHSCLLVDSREEALRFPTSDLRLTACPSCGFIWNIDFQPQVMRYSESYEETQAFSSHFRRFQTGLADRWIERYGLKERRLVEIGCGKGDFLVDICQRGDNHGIGIDPSYRPDRADPQTAGQTSFLQELYEPKHTRIDCDFLCCRHTLEHIHQPREFVELSRQQVAPKTDATVAYELPDVERVLEEEAFWDLYHEHCSYFSLGSLGRLFRSLQFEVLDLYKDYDGQYLIVESRIADHAVTQPHPAEEPVEKVIELVERFRRRVAARIQWWHTFIRQHHDAGHRIAIWGSGSKAVAFLSRLSLGEEISAVVDINPHKHGKFLAGVGCEILPPDVLKSMHPDVVIIMNPVYIDEISADLRTMGVDAEVIAL